VRSFTQIPPDFNVAELTAPAHALKGRKLVSSNKKKPETILLVEHHPLFLKLIKGILEGAKFRVLTASDPKEAKRVEAGFAGTIDLLLSEVMMPADQLGTKLAKSLKERRPKMRVILMSAYPGGELLLLNFGWHFIQQPFVPEGLVGRIREVLRSTIREQGNEHFDTRK
jgi:DNA-binding response OmpR family regulator